MGFWEFARLTRKHDTGAAPERGAAPVE